ncbi:MAG: outer membrane beta-barrel protein [Chitinophagaceae bacterium]|nr:outer membrane beta-barrel protein [Chitinophagaceae bacterium]
MKQLITILAAVLFCAASKAQTDSSKTADTAATVKKNQPDTIRIGNILIIKVAKINKKEVDITMGRKNKQKKENPNVSTNWGVIDLGFSNYIDNTNYGTAGSYLVNRPGFPDLGKNDFKVRTGKSINVNIWIFMQRLNLIKHHVNLKYGLGLELNNYRYKSSVSYKEGGPVPYTPNASLNSPFIFRDSVGFTKNKLAADYLTVPLMLNFVTHPGNNNSKGISLSVGISAGYLYSQRNKQRSDERGKEKNRGDYDLERFKLSYIAELGLGPVRLYGSYSPQSFYQQGLNIKPYNIGIRFSNW